MFNKIKGSVSTLEYINGVTGATMSARVTTVMLCSLLLLPDLPTLTLVAGQSAAQGLSNSR